jgi:biopolymer transport protein TolQ
MNIFRIFLESSLAAQIIMAVLSFLSIWSWGIFLKKLYDFAKLKKLNKRFLSTYRFHKRVKELENMGVLLTDNSYGRLLKSGLAEFRKLSRVIRSRGTDPSRQVHPPSEELVDNIRLAMEKAKISEVSYLESSLPVLSTIVSVSPFLGLLGTVWGVMVAFLDIRARGSAHITVVAPGISDALITTVYGLLVAIPALIFFNVFQNQSNNINTDLTKFVNEIFIRLKENCLSRSE